MVVLNMTRLVLLLGLVSATAGGQTASEPRVIHVAAERFAFTPSDITVEEGSVVELRLTSDDTDHGFRVHGLGDPNVLIPKRGRGCGARGPSSNAQSASLITSSALYLSARY